MKHSSASDGQGRFSQVARAEISRSVFDRSHSHKTTFDAGLLIPVLCDEALPGDTFNMRMHTFARMATPLNPVLDNLYLDSFFFAVPMRLLWENWQKFNGEQTDPGDSTDFTIPQLPSEIGSNELSDYLGIPPEMLTTDHSVMWHRAYNLIYSEWFRDQNLIDSPVLNTDDGPDLPADYVLRRRGKRHDYFASCLPWPQKGTAVELPLGSTAPLSWSVDPTVISAGDGEPIFTQGTDVDGMKFVSSQNSIDWDTTPSASGAATWSDPKLEADMSTGTGVADLSSATAATINQIRQAFQIQKLYERDARGGSRYTEIVRSHFGVTSPDQRLQRPEYLGGGSQNISVTPVPMSTFDGASHNLGDLGAFATSTGSSHAFQKSFVEHCIIIGLVSVRADLNYQQGLHRMFSRETRWDFFWPALQHTGEQAVLNKEIYAKGVAADDLTFGYQGRYDEYRYKPSIITGAFRSTAATPLDVWHYAQEFTTLPTLGETFIEDNPPIDRVIAVPSEPHFLFDAFFDYKCVRPMATFATPGMIDRF